MAGNPVNVSNGNKYEAEADYAGGGANPLKFVRSYNSLEAYLNWGVGLAQYNPFMGSAWMASYFQYLIPMSVTDSSTTYNAVYAYRPDGRMIVFTQYGGVYSPDGDVADSLMQTGSGWQYQTADDTIETYSAAGQLVSVAPRGQAPITVNYGTAGDPPASVSDAFGHSLQFTYGVDSTGTKRLTTIADPAGANIQYAYDTYGNLASVTHEDGTIRSYAYGNYSNSALMTLTDEASVAYASWTYANFGAQVATSQHASGVEAYSFSYATSGTGGSVSVTDPLGTTRTYNQQLIWAPIGWSARRACALDAARIRLGAMMPMATLPVEPTSTAIRPRTFMTSPQTLRALAPRGLGQPRRVPSRRNGTPAGDSRR